MSGNSPHLVIEVMPKCSINYEVICTMVATGVCKKNCWFSVLQSIFLCKCYLQHFTNFLFFDDKKICQN